MEQVKNPANNTDIFVVTGITGVGYDKYFWISNAYSTEYAANQCAKFLQKEANKIDNSHTLDEVTHALDNLKLFDPLAEYDESILYCVEKVRYVV